MHARGFCHPESVVVINETSQMNIKCIYPSLTDIQYQKLRTNMTKMESYSLCLSDIYAPCFKSIRLKRHKFMATFDWWRTICSFIECVFKIKVTKNVGTKTKRLIASQICSPFASRLLMCELGIDTTHAIISKRLTKRVYNGCFHFPMLKMMSITNKRLEYKVK